MTDRMELKTQKKEAALTVNELLYLIFFSVMLFSKGMGWYDGMRPYQLCLLIGMGCLGLKLILTKYTPWQLLVAAVFGVLGVLSWRCSAEKGMLTCVMMLIGMKDVRIKKVFQVGAVVWSGVFLYRILAFLIGWDKGILLVHKKLGAFIFRWSMGYPHPNVFHILSVAAKRQKAVWLDCCRACRKRTDFYLFSQLYRIFVDRNLSDAGAVF